MRVRQLLLKIVYRWLFADVTPHAIPIGYLPASTVHGNIPWHDLTFSPDGLLACGWGVGELMTSSANTTRSVGITLPDPAFIMQRHTADPFREEGRVK
ncbi:hypothetical protein HBI25_134930 [Parastagonospora nodorum]|nr:hypothetical protein HBI25_134930 [Parastagonospora nodorum]